MKTEEKTKVKKTRVEEPITIEEVNALIKYVVDNGLDPDGVIIGPLCDVVNDFIAEKKKENEDKGEERLIPKEILINYSKLTALASDFCMKKYGEPDGINGRTLLDTKNIYKWRSGLVMFWTMLFFILALGTESLDLWLRDIVEPEEGGLLFLINFHRYFLDNFSPFLWGATGAGVFLLKRLSDKAARRCFDSRRWQGWGSRIMLGALLGAIAVIIYDQTSFTDNTMNLGSNVIAFLAGLGIKVIYGSFEKIIDVLSEKFNLGTAKKGAASSETLRTFLNKELESVKNADKPSRKVIQDLISKITD